MSNKKHRNARGVTVAATIATPANVDVEHVDVVQPSPESAAAGVIVTDMETGETLPAVIVEPETATDETATDATPRKHMTLFTRGERRNGVGTPALNGLCHAAWRVADSLVVLDNDGNVEALPAVQDVLAVGTALGLNPGNIRIEFPNWRKFNGWHGMAFKRNKVAAE